MIGLEERFWSKVERGEECWLWRGALMGGRYGNFYRDGRMQGAHRVAYELANGPIPDGMLVDHQCGNKQCVRPSHLRLATRKQNAEHLHHLPVSNTSGALGVTWCKKTGRWRAQLNHNGRYLHVGRYDSVEEAAAAVADARLRLFSRNDHDRALRKLGMSVVASWTESAP